MDMSSLHQNELPLFSADAAIVLFSASPPSPFSAVKKAGGGVCTGKKLPSFAHSWGLLIKVSL